MHILMHDNALNERGTTKAIESYAQALSDTGWSVDIAFNSDNSQNIPEVIQRIGSKFQLIPYKEFPQLEQNSHHYDAAYFMKSGAQDGKVLSNTPSLIHAVFQEYEPHGQSYIYISNWLARKMKTRRFLPLNLIRGVRAKGLGCSNAHDFDFLPYICNVNRVKPFRDGTYGLNSDHFVILRYGGWDSFDIPWVQNELVSFVDSHPNAIALLVNTQPFCNHERIRFLPKFTSHSEMEHLLATCDVFIHGRERGESFGLAIVEVMQSGRQILSWSGGTDRNHIDLLDGSGALYTNARELSQKLESAYSGKQVVDSELLYQRAQQFRSEYVEPKLKNLLLAIAR